MKVVFVGADRRTFDMATLSIRLRWPDVMPLVATTAEQGLQLVEELSPELVILHPDFSDKSLSEAIRELRCFSNVPLLVLSQEGDEMEVVTALEQGADDYVRLPVDLTEMMARIWALLRRAGVGVSHQRQSCLVSGPLLINPATYEVFLAGARIELTSTEFRLLYLMVKNSGTVVSRPNLERVLWRETEDRDSSGLMKKYIQRLRQKLGDDAREPRWIVSIHGVGYRFIGPAPTPQLPGQDAAWGRVYDGTTARNVQASGKW
jgi:two-component system KDP operon response regulator KdpE